MLADKRPVNLGWRIDYCIISSSLVQHLKGAVIHKDVFGSDHCPVSVDLDLPWELSVCKNTLLVLCVQYTHSFSNVVACAIL